MQIIETEHFYNPGKDSSVYLEDVRAIEQRYGIGETISYHKLYREFENYNVLVEEAISTLSIALLAVFAVVLFMSASLQITVIVVCVVALVNLFMVGVSLYWGLYMNFGMTMNMSFCFGVAVDYSTHIAHTFQAVKAPLTI